MLLNLNLMKIDAHVHFLPPSLRENLAELVGREPYWGLLLNPPNGQSIQGYATAERLLADMDAAGLDRVVLVGEYYQRHESCVARNNQTIDLVQRYPERLMGLATVQPLAGAQATAELRRCLANGLCGLGELNPYAQRFRLASAEFERLVAICEEEDAAVNLHINEEVGAHYWGKSTTPIREYYELACRHPALKLVLAHWGGGLLFYEVMPRVRAQLANVVYDTAASPLLYPTAEIFATAQTCISPHKILYGSDYPLRLYPRMQKEPDFRPFLAEIGGLGLGEGVAAAVLGGNAARVYGRAGGRGSRGAGGQGSILPLPITGQVPLALLVQAYPECEPILAQAGVVVGAGWEPLAQAAAVAGLSPSQLTGLLAEVAAVVGGD